MVIAPAKTGRDKRRRIAVINTDQTNRGIRSKDRVSERILIIVEMKFTAPRIDLIPAKWREKIARSTEAPGCPNVLDKGG